MASFPNRIIDLRSDTVTQPTREMRKAMADAEVGDDYYREDPTVRRLEEIAADRLGKEAALLVLGGTMGNLVSLLATARRGDSALMEETSHIFINESGNLGDQVRGFGLTNDGVVDTVDRFLSAIVFRNNLLGPGVGIPDAQTRRNLEQYVLAFDTDLAPIVGQQITLTNTNGTAVNPRIDLLIARARAP